VVVLVLLLVLGLLVLRWLSQELHGTSFVQLGGGRGEVEHHTTPVTLGFQAASTRGRNSSSGIATGSHPLAVPHALQVSGASSASGSSSLTSTRRRHRPQHWLRRSPKNAPSTRAASSGSMNRPTPPERTFTLAGDGPFVRYLASSTIALRGSSTWSTRICGESPTSNIQISRT